METSNASRLQDAGIDPVRFRNVIDRIGSDVSRNLYPGAAFAIARHGKVCYSNHLGTARLARAGCEPMEAADDTLWLLYSQTKPITSSAVWLLVERGLLNLHKPVAFYLPHFDQHGKGDVTTYHLLTHQSGFPDANNLPQDSWHDKELLLRRVCEFQLQWKPGAKVMYHPLAAHWVQAALITTISGCDYRDFIKQEILQPLGLSNTFIGVPDSQHHRLAGAYELTDGEHVYLPDFNNADFFRSGIPGAAGYATASDIALFYQMLLNKGELNGVRVLSPRMVELAVRNHTGDRIDEFFDTPMHRGLGVHVRGATLEIRGMGSLASPESFGHGGVGSSYSWGDPATGVSFTYMTNSRLPEPDHSWRLEEIMNMVHASIVS